MYKINRIGPAPHVVQTMPGATGAPVFTSSALPASATFPFSVVNAAAISEYGAFSAEATGPGALAGFAIAGLGGQIIVDGENADAVGVEVSCWAAIDMPATVQVTSVIGLLAGTPANVFDQMTMSDYQVLQQSVNLVAGYLHMHETVVFNANLPALCGFGFLFRNLDGSPGNIVPNRCTVFARTLMAGDVVKYHDPVR